MDYKEKYNAALERARELSKTVTGANYEYIFPELQESEDERIRKTLIELVRCNERSGYFFLNNIETSSMIAWLEKQGEKESDPRYKYLEDLLTADDIHQMSMNEAMVEEAKSKAVNALSKLGISKLLGLEKQSQQTHAELGQLAVTKTSDQELSDKVEPKFKVGDCVISNDGTHTYLVKERKRGTYVILDIGEDKEYCIDIETADRTGRLWTIQDAKEGDVLVASDGSIFLFAGVDDCACKYYAALTTDNYVKINKEAKGGYWETSRAVYPATKEQRDLLFSKLKEAGYEWDTEKGLKKMRVTSKEFDDAYLQGICDAKHEIEKQDKKLDADEVINWLNDQACQGWIEDVEVDKFVEKFKKDFGL